MQWMFMPFKRYAEFQGRSRRKEYWLFALFLFIVYMVFGVTLFAAIGGAVFGVAGGDPGAGAAALFAGAGFAGIAFVIFLLALIIPSIAVGVRRLHDINRSGWWILAPTAINLIALSFTGSGIDVVLSFVGFIASIALLVFLCLPGTNGPNRFGADPKGGAVDLGEVFR